MVTQHAVGCRYNFIQKVVTFIRQFGYEILQSCRLSTMNKKMNKNGVYKQTNLEPPLPKGFRIIYGTKITVFKAEKGREDHT